MINYTVKLVADVALSKTLGSVEIVAMVLDEEGKKVSSGGKFKFRRRGAGDVETPLNNDSAKHTFEVNREDEKQSIRVYAEYTDPRGYTASESVLVDIPAKTKSDDKPDSQPPYRLILEPPLRQKTGKDQGKYELTARLTKDDKGQPRNVSGKVIEFFQGSRRIEIRPEPTTDSAGEAFGETGIIHQGENERTIRLSARTVIDARTIVSNTIPVTIPAKTDSEDSEPRWKFSRYDLDLQEPRHLELTDDRHRFVLSARLTRVEYCTRGDKKGDERKIPIAGKGVFFEVNWIPIDCKGHTPLTDKNGWVNLETPDLPAEKDAYRIDFSATADTGDGESEDVRSNSVFGILPKRKTEDLTPHLSVQESETPNWKVFDVSVTESADKTSALLPKTIQITSTSGAMLLTQVVGTSEWQKGQGLLFPSSGRVSLRVKLASLPQGMAGEHIIIAITGTQIASKPYYISGLFLAPSEHGGDQTQTIPN